MHFRGGGIGHTTGHNIVAGNYVSPQLFKLVGYNPEGIDENAKDLPVTDDIYDYLRDSSDSDDDDGSSTSEMDCGEGEGNGGYVDLKDMVSEDEVKVIGSDDEETEETDGDFDDYGDDGDGEDDEGTYSDAM